VLDPARSHGENLARIGDAEGAAGVAACGYSCHACASASNDYSSWHPEDGGDNVSTCKTGSLVRARAIAIGLLAAVLSACSTIPEEVVKLSYAVGQDMDALRASYKTLIHEHYETLRSRRQDYLDQVWKPALVKTWIADGHLVQIASGREIWSDEKNAFVDANPARDAGALLDNVSGWAEQAVDAIAKKRQELMGPLDAEEKELTASIEDGFSQVMRGNAAITAHLNSLRRVQGVQDDLLQAAGLKDLRTKINDKLSSASERAAKALDTVQEADKKLTNATRKLQTMKKIN
jgi:hypothetical protein